MVPDPVSVGLFLKYTIRSMLYNTDTNAYRANTGSIVRENVSLLKKRSHVLWIWKKNATIINSM